MKNWYRLVTAFLVAIITMSMLQGCLKDSMLETYKIYTPIFKTLSQVRAGMKGGPAQPLKNTGKLNVASNYIFLNEVGKGIHVIDNSNPKAPKNISFISIPANTDLAVKGSYLYADSYSDLVVFDISQPTAARPVKFLNNVIKERDQYWFSGSNPDSLNIIVGYSERDTTVDYREYRRWMNCPNCALVSSTDLRGVFYTAAPQQSGVGGSMAQFTIVDNYLYAVSSTDLYSVGIANPEDPQLTSAKNLGWSIETIYPSQNKLFIGSRQGMFIYSLANPSAPAQLGQFTHVTSCDPVIADDTYAYVTLRSGTTCNGSAVNQMDVLNVSNLSSPYLVSTVAMTNPHGLAKDGNKIFVCDGSDGLKMYDAANKEMPTLQRHITGLETFDVIALEGRAIVVAKDGLYQYSYDGSNSLSFLSKLSIDATK